MSELFTQNYSDKPLFHTDTDISESLHNQVDEASNGEELLDSTEKQTESLLSNDDYVSETKDTISDDSDDVSESLSPPAEGNRKYITGTNTPRASRSNAYYELLCNQQTNGYRSPAMRGTTAAAHGITSASGLVSYQEDFATDAAQDLGVHGAAAELIMQETFLGTAAKDVGILGSYAVKGIKDVQDGTRTAEEVLHTGGDVLRMELGSSAVQIGSAGARTALHYAETFSTSADDFADRAPGIISNTGFQAGHSVIKVARFFAHPVKALASIGRTALICGTIVLLLLIIGLLGQMGGTATTSVLCADRPEDIQQLVESINTYRNEAATDELRRAFRNDVDPNGNPYGYDTLTGQRSNNMQHGVTWSYANGIYNDTAEIISMAAVYYQQDWPSSQELAAFTDDVPFTQYCRALTAYGMEITARESAPYSCISYGGCVNGYRSEGETVTITEYRCETHTCAQGNEECGHYRNGIWEWSDDHAEGSSRPEWIEGGTHDVTVFFPVIFPDGATRSELCALPDNYTQVVDGKIAAENCTGSIVLDESANLYKGELNDWFYAPNERTATITVETTDGDEVMTKDYNALHDALNRGLPEVIRVRLHRQAENANHNVVFPARIVIFVSLVCASNFKDTVCYVILACSVTFNNSLNQIFGHVGIVGKQLLGVLGQTVATICTHLLLRQRTGKGQADFFCRDRDSSHAGCAGTQAVLFQLIQHLLHRAGRCLFQGIQQAVRYREVRAHCFVQQRTAAVHQVQEVADALGCMPRHR